MTCSFIQIFGSVIVFASIYINTVECISCYQCNSRDDPYCDNINDHPPHLAGVYYKECEGLFDGEDPFCRKIAIRVIHGEIKRVIRTCGWVKSGSGRPCYNADNDDHDETACQCFTDGCNGSSNLKTFGFSLSVLIAIIVPCLLSR